MQPLIIAVIAAMSASANASSFEPTTVADKAPIEVELTRSLLPSPAEDFYAMPEALYGVMILSDDIVVRVASSGCTGPDSFDVDVAALGDDAYSVAFRRVEVDHCRALLIDGAELRFSRTSLGVPPGARVVVENAVER